MKRTLQLTVILMMSLTSYAQVGNWPANAQYLYFGANELGQGNPGNYATLQDKTNGNTFLNSPSNIYFRIGNGDRMLLTNSGNFGIGTTSPTTTLDVNGPIAVQGVKVIEYGGTDVYANIRVIRNNSPSNTDGMFINYGGSGGPSAHLRFYANGTSERMRIDAATGNVGIGTATPLGLLEIKGPYNGNSQLIVNTTGSTGELRFSDNGVAKGFVWYGQGGNYMAFGRGSVSNSMFVNASGDFGIGTTTPDSKLSVKGTIHTQEVKVDLNGAVAPDYVFEKDYPLTSLEELKSYIDQNKHLPEIPSAKEMEEEGINLKEMNLLLLKKVEELTLHILSQEQRIQQLEKSNQEK